MADQRNESGNRKGGAKTCKVRPRPLCSLPLAPAVTASQRIRKRLVPKPEGEELTDVQTQRPWYQQKTLLQASIDPPDPRPPLPQHRRCSKSGRQQISAGVPSSHCISTEKKQNPTAIRPPSFSNQHADRNSDTSTTTSSLLAHRS